MIINKEKIAELRELEKETGEIILLGLVILFKRDFPTYFSSLKELIHDKEYLKAGKIAHKVKTSCFNIGITAGYEICLELETQCKKSDHNFNYELRLRRLHKVLTNAIKELEREIKNEVNGHRMAA